VRDLGKEAWRVERPNGSAPRRSKEFQITAPFSTFLKLGRHRAQP
jgi:hypothetical protein